MSLLAAVAAGGAVGVHHALEADHLAAVTALVDGDESAPGLAGASWAAGHAVPVTALGLAVVLAGVRLSGAVSAAFEVAVGVVLVGLGLRLLSAARGDHGEAHGHLAVGDLRVGWDHSHLHGESAVVGVLHGFAGSGALVVVLVSTTPSVGAALAFLLAFAAATVVTMSGVAVAWDRALGTPVATPLRAAAGVAGIVVGASLVAGAWPALPV